MAPRAHGVPPGVQFSPTGIRSPEAVEEGLDCAEAKDAAAAMVKMV